MKHLRIAFLALLLVAGYSNVNAQDENNPWAIGIGINAVDFYPTNHPSMLTPNGNSTAWFDNFFNADDHYNIIPSLSRITVGKYLNGGFSFEVAGSLNKIEKIGNTTPSRTFTYFGLDGGIKYDLNNIFGDSKWFDPYALVGGGYTWIDKVGGNNGAGTLNGGLGANLWLNKRKNFGLNIQTMLKQSFEPSNNIVIPHFQHAAGIVMKFGGKDTDGDGIYDKDDACPEVFGLEIYNGCPDTDGDGIIDGEDACPSIAGLAAFNGCVDSDGDGLADPNDSCPKEAGPKENKGCPWSDTDGDGVLDKDDKCVSEAGPKENNGCPWTDRDGDGVLDKDDACPDVVGLVTKKGCPDTDLPSTVQSALRSYARTIVFDTGKTTIKSQSAGVLNDIIGILNQYPSSNFTIEGHTDSVGSAAMNQRLSEGRARAVLNYLTSRGISSSRLSSAGYGETRPIDSNKTSEGRRANRRVEINLRR